MEKGITLEQALTNIEIVIVEHFRGSRKEHIALEDSINIIKNTVESHKKCPTCKCDADIDCVKAEPKFTQDISPEASC